MRVVGDCDLVQEFLSADVYEVFLSGLSTLLSVTCFFAPFQRDSVSIDVEVKIMLPDRSVTVLKIKRFLTADRVYDVSERRRSDFSDRLLDRYLGGGRENRPLKRIGDVFLSFRNSRLYIR